MAEANNVIAPDMQKFIDEYKNELVRWVQENCKSSVDLSDDSLEDIIINTQPWYMLARECGVDV